jgi:CubicO group peptidase (beta-lactamase class C family)
MEGDIRPLLERGVADGVFPGAVAVLVEGDEVVARVAVGRRMVFPESRPMRAGTLFDLASLTKPLATAPAVLLLAEDGALSLDDPVILYLPEFARPDVSVRHLLTHTSGLPAWRAVYTEAGDRSRVVSHIGSLPPQHAVGSKIVYSCLGYIVLGELVRAVTGADLGAFFSAHIGGPLALRNTLFNPPPERASECAATESAESAKNRRGNDYVRGAGVLCGVVHDENAYFLGGIAGNAGLFSTADDLARYARALLRRGRPAFSPAVYTGLAGVVADDGETRRTHAWIALPDGSLSHTGFTGTAMRWYPARGRAAILLTNRVHPDATNGRIQEFRQEFFRVAFSGRRS